MDWIDGCRCHCGIVDYLCLMVGQNSGLKGGNRMYKLAVVIVHECAKESSKPQGESTTE